MDNAIGLRTTYPLRIAIYPVDIEGYPTFKHPGPEEGQLSGISFRNQNCKDRQSNVAEHARLLAVLGSGEFSVEIFKLATLVPRSVRLRETKRKYL